MQSLTLGWLAIAGGALTPLLTGLFTKIKASSQLQAVVTFCLAAGIGAGQSVISAPHTGVSVSHMATTILSTWFLAIVAHYGLWKPTGITAVVQNLAPSFGLNDAPTQIEQPALAFSAETLDAIAQHLGATPQADPVNPYTSAPIAPNPPAGPPTPSPFVTSAPATVGTVPPAEAPAAS